jgi:predicted DNA-binding transcriptional regulator YafY
MFALLVAHKAIAQYHGTPFHQPLQMAFQKLITHLDTHERYSLDNFRQTLSFRPFAPEDADLRAFEAVTRAITERRVLLFQYRKPGTKKPESRHVRPYHLTCTDNRWYLLAHDTDRGEIRTFVLSRLSVPRVTDERFEKPPDFDPEKYLRGSFTVMKGNGDHEVVIEFDPWAADVVRGRQWHSSQQVTDLPDGRSRMTMRLTGLEEVERWVLSWGTHATVISPPALAARVRSIATALVERYPNVATSGTKAPETEKPRIP